MFSEADSKTSPWQDIDTQKINWLLRWCTEFPSILNSQCNLNQLLENKINFVCAALLVPDPSMINNKLILKQAQGTLSTYLNPKRLTEINNGQLKPYPDLLNEDLDVLMHPENFGVTDKKVVVLKRKEDYNENDFNTLHVVFSIEGCHTLSPTLDSNLIKVDEVLTNLEELRKKVSVISINITHIESYPFCNQAYGIQFIAAEGFRPTGNRVTEDGIKIIQYCYNHNILLDLKHLSLAARKMIIEDIQHRPEFNDIRQPLVCTHAGFTGLSYSSIPDYIMEFKKDKKYSYIRWGKPKMYEDFEMIAFNPSSINLYDEEIIGILESGGLIGLSLDKRILGYSEQDSRSAGLDELTYEEEYVSNFELDVFVPRKKVGQKATDEFCITTQEVLQGGAVNPALGAYHLKHFMAHVLHLVVVAKAHNYAVDKALQQVCIGSDFDGLINPVWCCDSITKLQSLEKQFIDSFPPFAKTNKVRLDPSFNIETVAKQLFFENGKQFVLERLAKIGN
jgi:microsomal dipeptidase-like Zn-dependent dipeptidase